MSRWSGRRTIAVQALLLAGALVWAYGVSHPSRDRPSGPDRAFTLWSLSPEEVSRVRILLDKTQLDLEPLGDGDRPYLWVTARLPVAPPQGRAPEEEPGEPEGARGPRLQFKGNASAEQAFASLTTLLAQRRIGALEELKGEAFGLPSEAEFIEIERRDGDPLRLNLGGTTYGDMYRYAHFTRDGSVYLIRQSLLQNLARTPARMMDRELFPFPVPQAERAELRSSEKVVSFWRLPGAAPDSDEWGDAPEAGTGDPAMRGFMDDLARLKVAGYLEREPAQAPGDGQALEIRLTAKGHPVSWLRFIEAAEGSWNAKSSHTRRVVRLDGQSAAPLVEAALGILRAR
jgi:hypothetical protein